MAEEPGVGHGSAAESDRDRDDDSDVQQQKKDHQEPVPAEEVGTSPTDLEGPPGPLRLLVPLDPVPTQPEDVRDLGESVAADQYSWAVRVPLLSRKEVTTFCTWEFQTCHPRRRRLGTDVEKLHKM